MLDRTIIIINLNFVLILSFFFLKKEFFILFHFVLNFYAYRVNATYITGQASSGV